MLDSWCTPDSGSVLLARLCAACLSVPGGGAHAATGSGMLLERWTLAFTAGVNSSSNSRAAMDTAAVYKRLVGPARPAQWQHALSPPCCTGQPAPSAATVTHMHVDGGADNEEAVFSPDARVKLLPWRPFPLLSTWWCYPIDHVLVWPLCRFLPLQILLIRSLYSTVRILPAYRMYRACKRHGGELFNTRYSLSTTADPSMQPLQHWPQHHQQQATGLGMQIGGSSSSSAGRMCHFAFTPVEALGGAFSIYVEYQPAATVHILEVSSSSSQHMDGAQTRHQLSDSRMHRLQC